MSAGGAAGSQAGGAAQGGGAGSSAGGDAGRAGGGAGGAAGDGGAAGEGGAAAGGEGGGAQAGSGQGGDAQGGAAQGGAAQGGAGGDAQGGSAQGGQGGGAVEPSPWGPNVILVDLDANNEAIIDLDLSQGAPIDDLSWAAYSNVACFPATQFSHFTGNHVLLALREQMPPSSTLTITAEPAQGVEVSMYGYMAGSQNYFVPPYVPSAAACEASHSKSLSGAPDPGVAESIFLANPTGHTYNVLWGVAGDAATGQSGAFKVKVKLVADETTSCVQPAQQAPKEWADSVHIVKLDANGEAELGGDLGDGAKVCSLAFAADGQIACFPETQFAHFGGNHVFYAIEGGQPPKSQVEITVVPEPGVEANLYGYRMATTSFYTPPYVPSVNTCEASFPATLSGAPNPGDQETILFSNPGGNPYNIFFAVAGDDLTGQTGAYKVKVKVVKAAESSCGDTIVQAPADKWPTSVKQIALDAGGAASVQADLSTGKAVCDLSFASQSSVACWPATDNVYFAGPHTFYALKEPLPAGSHLKVTATPAAGVDVNVYGYWLGTTRFYTPPYVPSIGACEAGYDANLGDATNPGVAESFEIFNPTGNEYNVFFAVAAPGNGPASGAYTLDVKVDTPPPPHCPESLPGGTYASWPSQVSQVNLDDTGKAQLAGDLSSGSCTNLGFADDSDVACFPATEFSAFTGNHVFYALSQPIPPGSELTITATPGASGDVSLYAYMMGAKSFYVPPNVPQAITCEASYGKSGPNPGAAETIKLSNPTGNPYNVFFAVAGEGASGAYTVDVSLATSTPHCPESLPGPDGKAWPSSVNLLSLSGGKAHQTGDLSSGACTSLGFADDSDVACFPATQGLHYTGNHVFYALSTPVETGKKVTVTATPRAGVEVSLYGYLMGSNSFYVPPNVPTVVTCEASSSTLLSGEPNPGMKETITFYPQGSGGPYNVFFAVAGDGLTGQSGAFDVDVTVE